MVWYDRPTGSGWRWVEVSGVYNAPGQGAKDPASPVETRLVSASPTGSPESAPPDPRWALSTVFFGGRICILSTHIPEFLMRVLLLALFLGSVCLPASGQRARARMLIGVSGYTLKGEGASGAERIFRLAGGGGLSVELLPMLSVRAELRYTIQGGRMRGTVDGAIGGEPTAIPVEGTFDLTYLEIPLLAVVGFDLVNGHRLELGAGPGLGLKVDTRSSFAAETGPEFSQALDGPGRTAGWAVAADYIFRVGTERVIIGLRGWRSITKAGLEGTVPGAEDVYTQGFSVMSGLTF